MGIAGRKEMTIRNGSPAKKQKSKRIADYFKSVLLTLVMGLLPLIMFWANNLGQIRFSEVYNFFLIDLLVVFCLFNLLFLVVRSLPKVTLISVVLILLFFSYGHIDQVLPASSLFSGTNLFFFYILIFFVVTFLIFRAKRLAEGIFFFLSLAAVFLLVINFYQILRFDPRLFSKTKNETTISITSSQAQSQPDVYYIVLDAYARDDELQETYGYDNSDFLKALRSRGFYIPECAQSNYEETQQTIPSVMNMEYLNALGIPDDNLDELSSPLIDLTLNNQVRQIFGSMGYTFVTARGWGAFNDITDSDVYLNYYDSIGQTDTLAADYFGYNFLNTTLIRAYSHFTRTAYSPQSGTSANENDVSRLNMGLEYEKSEFWYNQTLYVFESLEKLPDQAGGPYLVYAHINAPHGPYVFNRDGSFRFEPDLSNEESLYIDSIVYINQRVLHLIDTLIANSDTPPVIILQADHGTHYYDSGINKHKILSAYYLPGTVDIPPYATLTPVNDFRLVLHDYFDPSIQLLPDTLYVKGEEGYKPQPATCDLP
jgi:hypothetical protein